MILNKIEKEITREDMLPQTQSGAETIKMLRDFTTDLRKILLLLNK